MSIVERVRELILASATASPDHRPADRIRALAAAEVDWPLTVAVARAHGVLPIVHARLRQHAAASMPAHALGAFSAASDRIAARSLRLTNQLFDVLQTLERGGIEALAFKGPVLAAVAYGSAALREFGDLDLLVRRSDLPRAIALMARENYSLPEPYARLMRGAYPPAEYHVMMMPNEAGRVGVELHGEALMWYFSVRWPTGDLFARARCAIVAGRRIPTFGNEDLLLFLAAHATTHAWRKLEYVVAIAALIERLPTLDWTSVAGRAHELGIERILAVGLRLARGLTGQSLPPEAVLLADADPGAGRLADRLALRMFRRNDRLTDPLWRLWVHWASRECAADRTRYCVRTVINHLVIAASHVPGLGRPVGGGT